MKTGNKVKNVKNHVIFTYENRDYRYDDIYNLIKDLDYKKVGDDFDYIVKEVFVNGQRAACLFLQESDSSEDWVHNFMFWSTYAKAYKGWENKLKFMKGFFVEYNSGRDEVIKDLKEFVDSGVTKIFVTGWSNGASTAPIACEDIYYQFKIKPTFIGYEGAHPCYNKHTRDYVYSCMADDSISFVNKMDAVCRCPPFAWRIKPIIYYFKKKEKFPIFIRKLIDCIKNTAFYHCNVDTSIQNEM